MTDYTTRITASRDKIWKLKNNLLLFEPDTVKGCQEQASVYGMLHNEYLELAAVYKDMEKKGEKP